MLPGSGIKENNSGTDLRRLMKRMQQGGRNYGVILAIFVFIGFTIYYMGMLSAKYVTKDTAALVANFDVKTLDPELTDEELAKLDKNAYNYLTMIDAGSSGCRAHVYRYGRLGGPTGPIYILPDHESKKVKPGLSSFAKNPTDAGASLEGLVEFIKSEVPQMQWKETPIWLKATAGLRLLPKSESDAILDSVRAFLGDSSKSPFLFRPPHAKIISGNEEGGFGWIAFNYLKKIIGPKKFPGQYPYAVVEMGGASSQVSQAAPNELAAKEIPEEYRFSVTIEGETFHLYTHSYLGYGAEQARESINKNILADLKGSSEISDPCLNPGYKRDEKAERKEVYEGPNGSLTVKGAASDKECTKAASNLFQKDKQCETGKPGPFSFGCVYQPAFVAASRNFLVFENFYYVSSALGIGANGEKSGDQFPLVTTVQSFVEASKEVCSTEWDEVQKKYPKDSQPKDVNVKLCFGSSYASEFLTKGLGLSEDKRVTIQKEVDGSEIEWALGAAYKEAMEFAKPVKHFLRPG